MIYWLRSIILANLGSKTHKILLGVDKLILVIFVLGLSDGHIVEFLAYAKKHFAQQQKPPSSYETAV